MIKNRIVPAGEGDASGGVEDDVEEGSEDGDGEGRVGRSAWYG